MRQEQIGNIASRLMYRLEHEGSPDYLRNHPGLSATTLEEGAMELARLRGFDFETTHAGLRSVFDAWQVHCESPIERELLAALVCVNWRQFGIDMPLFVPPGTVPEERHKIIILPQASVAKYRLDFLISVEHGPYRNVFAVECDGREYHDAAADRARDAVLSLYGIGVLRATGSEIRKDPHAIARKIVGLIACYRTGEAAS